MNYANHNLRTDLQEWKNRLYRANSSQFYNQFKYFLNNIKANLQLKGFLDKALNKHPYSKEDLDGLSEPQMQYMKIDFETEIQQTAFCYQFLSYIIKETGSYNIRNLIMFNIEDFDYTKTKFIEDYISPIIYYLHDKLDKSNSTIYLLEKYKKRTEWFKKNELYNSYKSAEKNYEQLLEDDLRLFLFDQGIDYPFSTPLSASGRADIIGEIDTEDPLIVEIKIFDRAKNYGKGRIKDGFNQIVKYANDYNKDVGYLVVFNMDKAELNLSFSDNSNIFPPKIRFNNKTFYFVIINSVMQESASKLGTIQEVEITEDELTKK